MVLSPVWPYLPQREKIMKSNKIAFVVDPIAKLNVKKDSSIAMMLEAQQRHWGVYVIEPQDLYIIDGHAYARVKKITVNLHNTPWYELAETEIKELTEFAAILLRKDPPVDMAYLHLTYVLDLAETAGVLMINKPQAVRDANEKIFLSYFPQCAAATIFSMNREFIKEFIIAEKKVALKPLDGMGGKSVFVVTAAEPNLNVILETLTKNFSEMITVQKYIPEITEGDKRIIVINGEPIPYALARIPAQGETRGNLAAGGIGKVVELTERDYWICEQVAPVLKQKGLIFVGLDVIGDYLTEVNVTSPTCIREISAETGINIAGKLMDYIEATAK